MNYEYKILICLCSDLTISLSSGGGQGPRFIYEPPSFQGFSNNTGGSLSCSGHGVPQPRISWLEGGNDQVKVTLMSYGPFVLHSCLTFMSYTVLFMSYLFPYIHVLHTSLISLLHSVLNSCLSVIPADRLKFHY